MTHNEYMKIYNKKYPWKHRLVLIKLRCNNPQDKAYKWYGKRGIKCLITEEEIKKLWFRDKAYLMLRPTIDRKDNNGNPFLYSEGTVSGFDRRSGDLIVGMPSGPGNSGSGIFTQDGYLTGILYAGQMFPAVPFGAAIDTAHGICVNSQVLRLFLSEYFE